MRVVFDIETDGLLDTLTKVHCLVAIDIDTEEIYKFHGEDWLVKFRDFYQGVDLWVGHNVIDFDIRALERLTDLSFPREKVLDTLVLSRLNRFKRSKGHSLDAWGQYLKYPKLDFNDYSKFSEEMLAYCVNDVQLNLQVYNKLWNTCFHKPEWQQAIKIEHDMAWLCSDMNDVGFKFDYDKAMQLLHETQGMLEELTAELQQAFPPKLRFVREVVPKARKDGTMSTVGLKWYDGPTSTFAVDSPMSRVESVPFNPGSPRQVVERLRTGGWNPVEKTKGHIQFEKDYNRTPKVNRTPQLTERLQHFKQYGWKVSEKNLATLPEGDTPELIAARKLVKWLMLESRRSTLEEWTSVYNPYTGRIHGRFSSIGAWTQRMSHKNPNMANVPAAKTRYRDKDLEKLAISYGHNMRKLWTCDTDEYLVGTDADGIQLRILAHYMDDVEFTQALVEGRKEDRTDAHSLNQRNLQPYCKDRDTAKTFIYAFLLGAGTSKIAEILQCGLSQAKKAKEDFIAAYPGLQHLKDVVIPRDAERGYFVGLDGRLVMCDSEHLMLAGYLQNGEKVIMSHACRTWRDEAERRRYNFRQVNFVHDEWQTVVKGNKETAESLGRIQSDSFGRVGQMLKLNCPLAGQYDVGKNWDDTH